MGWDNLHHNNYFLLIGWVKVVYYSIYFWGVNNKNLPLYSYPFHFSLILSIFLYLLLPSLSVFLSVSVFLSLSYLFSFFSLSSLLFYCLFLNIPASLTMLHTIHIQIYFSPFSHLFTFSLIHHLSHLSLRYHVSPIPLSSLKCRPKPYHRGLSVHECMVAMI